MRLLVTGGAGFIGSNFVRYWVDRHPDDAVVAYDVLTYAGNRPNLSDVEDRIEFVQGDIGDLDTVAKTLDAHQVDVIVNFAAESHNSLAILDPARFFRTNVLGTQTLAEAARRHGVVRFHHISTCEVYGDLPLDSDEVFTEETPYRPRTPYNASKAGGDHAVRAYVETYGLPATITNCCNNYGPFQFPEKVIPLFTARALDDQPLPLYASTQNRREWLHVDDHCRAIELVLQHGEVGETYNVGSGVEASIEEIADAVLTATAKPASLKEIVPDRPSHDRRYLLDSSKIRSTSVGSPPCPSPRGSPTPWPGTARTGAGGSRCATGRRSSKGPGPRPTPCPARRRDGDRRGAGPRHRRRRPAGTGPARRHGRPGARRGGRPRRPPGRGHPAAGARRLPSTSCRPTSTPWTWPTGRRSAPPWRASGLTSCSTAGPSPRWTRASPTSTPPSPSMPSAPATSPRRPSAWVPIWSTSPPTMSSTGPPPGPTTNGTHRVRSRSTGGASSAARSRSARIGAASATIVRTAWVSGAHGANMVKTVLRLAASNPDGPLRFVDDQRGCPTFTADLSRAVVRLALDRRPGTFHVTNQGETTWYGFARATLAAAGLEPGVVEPIATSELDPPRPAPRPANSRLDNAALRLSGLPLLPEWTDALDRLVRSLPRTD